MVLLEGFVLGVCHLVPPIEASPSSVERRFGAGNEDWGPAVKGHLGQWVIA